MIKSVAKFASSAVLGLASILAAPAASAAIVTGSWDPVLPSPFQNLGWVAAVNMRIDNNCVLNQAGPFAVNIFGGQFGCTNEPTTQGFTLLRAQVGFYSTLSGAIVEVMEFTPPETLGVQLVPSNGGFQLALGLSAAEQGQTPATLGLSFKLAVTDALPVLFYQDTGNPGSYATAPGTPQQTFFEVEANDNQQQAVLDRTRLNLQQIVATPTAVPEPGSLALALLALGAAGAVAARGVRRAV